MSVSSGAEFAHTIASAPSLFAGFDDIQPAELHHANECNPDHHSRDSDKDLRLGRQFERQVLALIDAAPDLQLVCCNLVIQGDQRTLGELDAVVFDQRAQCYEHWEITLKFYLGVRANHWPGPDPRDSFDRRLRRLRDHQFALSNTPQAQQALAAAGVPRIDRRRLFSRGRLYYPTDTQLAPPSGAHVGHARGQWWSRSTLPADWLWEPIPKPQWLCLSPMSNKSTNRVAGPELLDYVQQARSPVMVNAYSSHSASLTPGFVVPDFWLSDAQSSQHNS